MIDVEIFKTKLKEPGPMQIAFQKNKIVGGDGEWRQIGGRTRKERKMIFSEGNS